MIASGRKFIFKFFVVKENSDTSNYDSELAGVWCALPRSFSAGEQVLKYTGYDYGLVRDDAIYGNTETVCCCLDEKGLFFTVPCSFLVDEGGNQIEPEYVIRRKVCNNT